MIGLYLLNGVFINIMGNSIIMSKGSSGGTLGRSVPWWEGWGTRARYDYRVEESLGQYRNKDGSIIIELKNWLYWLQDGR